MVSDRGSRVVGLADALGLRCRDCAEVRGYSLWSSRVVAHRWMTAIVCFAYAQTVRIAKPAAASVDFAWLWRGPGWTPLGVATVVGLIQVVGTHFAAQDQSSRASLDALAYALLVAGPVALLWRKRYPGRVAVVITGITLAYLLLNYPFGPIFLSLIVAYFTAITEGQRVLAWASGLALYAGHFAIKGIFDIGDPITLVQVFGVAAWLLIVLVASEGVRLRREHAVDVARNQQEETRRRASEERLRIAQELHDVLAHNVSLISVQANVALHLMDEQPDQARVALTAIKQASRDALGELRSVLAVLRHIDEGAPRAPTPGLDQLDDLISNASISGITVRKEITGTARSLPSGVELAALRIIQEALTNVTRHAGSATATVRLRYGDDELGVEIEDSGNGVPVAASTGGGHGIQGMRERANALGGTLEAGAKPHGGFRVAATLPVDTHA